MIEDNLSIRAYSKQQKGHVHAYHQLVLPILGTIIIELEGYRGKVSVGECVVIQAQAFHLFKADEAARFIVADLNELPDSLINMASSVFSMSAPLRAYLLFIEQQLEYKVDKPLEKMMLEIFTKLLSEQSAGEQIDPRVRRVLQFISDDLSLPFNINQLAEMACLSPTQFKKVFKQCTGQSLLQHITVQRMEKAKALLTHTDVPVQLISEQVGYNDVSAFSRRFSQFYQLSPRQIRS